MAKEKISQKEKDFQKEYDLFLIRFNNVLEHTKAVFKEKGFPSGLFSRYSEMVRSYSTEVIVDSKTQGNNLYIAYVEDLEKVCEKIESRDNEKDADKLTFFKDQMRKWLTIIDNERCSDEKHEQYFITRKHFFLVLFGQLGATDFKKEFTIQGAKQSIFSTLRENHHKN